MAALLIVLKIIVAIFVILGVIAFVKKPSSVYRNQPEEKKTHGGQEGFARERWERCEECRWRKRIS